MTQLSLFGSFDNGADDAHEELVARVVFDSGPDGEFDYRVPRGLAGEIEVGQRLRVPLGRSNRLVTGYCIELHRKSGTAGLKPVAGILDPVPLLSPSLLDLARWMASYYLCPLRVVLETVIPACVRQQAGTRAVPHFRLAARPEDLSDLTGKQMRVVEVLLLAPQRRLSKNELLRQAGCSSAVLERLVQRGVLVKEAARIRQTAVPEVFHQRQTPLSLNEEQRAALKIVLDAAQKGLHRTIVLFGVTGSGKTEVYIQAIEEVVRNGRQAIVLVPEISLTPQTVERFRSRFDHVAVLHSHLTDAERAAQWEWIASGQVQVVVGARSAIFAPTPRLGLIVMDEEHETSFKQEAAPRYHAREVAVQRAILEKIPVVLGSATPSLESWYRAQQGVFTLVKLSQRIGGLHLPAVKAIDLRQPRHGRESRGVITRQLHAAIHQALEEGGQVILLLNRRGFATHIQCTACGFVQMCPECDIALTHHRSFGKVLCHYCGHEAPAPQTCPECQSPAIRFSGVGTERLEAEVRARFPNVSCLRMDADSMRSRQAYEKAFRAFREGKVQILLGTQMIAKGLDFPRVTLVGVINADTALHFPDFRAAERTFQLVTQVAGRTGRGPQGGQVLVQTFSPDHFAIQAAVRHDFESFAAQELPIRKAFGYPPVTHLIRLVISAKQELQAVEWSQRLAGVIRGDTVGTETASGEAPTNPRGFRLVGPAPAPLVKLRGQYRYHLQVFGDDPRTLHARVQRALEILPQPSDDLSWTVDVDPVDML